MDIVEFYKAGSNTCTDYLNKVALEQYPVKMVGDGCNGYNDINEEKREHFINGCVWFYNNLVFDYLDERV